MKKFFVLIIIATLIFGATACTASDDTIENAIRIHIRADSNDASDQEVKLKVRDTIIAYLTPKLQNLSSKEDAKRVLLTENQNLTDISNKVLIDNGFTYKASITLTREEFPYRTYNGTSFPSGIYDALIVNLGSGEGDNWWCVCFPPLCFQNDDEDFRYKSRLKEWFSK